MGREHVPLIDRRDSLKHGNQILTVAGVTMSLFATGNIMGFSAVTIPTLLSKDSTIRTADPSNMSWMASLVTVGCIVGTLIGAVCSDAIGRKRTILLASLIYTAGWIVIAQGTDISELLTGRMLTGIASGFYGATVQVYICEIVEPELRGVSGSLPTFMVSLGILSMYCLGSILPWRSVALICSVFPLFVFTYVLFLPESPVWLIAKGHQPDALKSLTWLRNDAESAEAECLRLQYLKERRASTNSFSLRNCCSRMWERPVLNPLIISMMCFAFQQFSGVYPIIFYATLIFKYADHFINDYLETVVVGFVRMFSTLIALFLINFMKRRTLLIMSSLFMSCSTGLLGGYFYFREVVQGDLANSTIFHPLVASDELDIEWIPLACLILFMAAYSIGFGIIPYFLCAELMPSDVRSLACSIALSFNQICMFTAVKTFVDVVDIFESYGTFWVYATTSLFGAVFVFAVVPETSNLHHGDIEEIFQHKYRRGRDGSTTEETGF